MAQKSSFGFRLKKNLGTKFASTKKGREIITRYFGTEGAQALGAAISAIAKHTSPDNAKEIERQIFVYTVKTTLLGVEDVLTPENTAHLADPTMYVGYLFLEALTPEDDAKSDEEDDDAAVPAAAKPPVAIDPAPLIAHCRRTADLTYSCISPHMSEKNCKQFRELLDYLTSADFLTALLTREDILPERAELYRIVEPMDFTGFEFDALDGADEAELRARELRRQTLDVTGEGRYATTAIPDARKILLEGWVTKRGQIRKSWKQRWFVLDSEGFLYYYDKKGGALLQKGVIDLKEAKSVTTQTGAQDKALMLKKSDKVIVINMRTRSYYLLPVEGPTLDDWLRVLAQSIGKPAAASGGAAAAAAGR